MRTRAEPAPQVRPLPLKSASTRTPTAWRLTGARPERWTWKCEPSVVGERPFRRKFPHKCETQAQRQGLPPETLVNLWILERLKKGILKKDAGEIVRRAPKIPCRGLQSEIKSRGCRHFRLAVSHADEFPSTPTQRPAAPEAGLPEVTEPADPSPVPTPLSFGSRARR